MSVSNGVREREREKGFRRNRSYVFKIEHLAHELLHIILYSIIAYSIYRSSSWYSFVQLQPRPVSIHILERAHNLSHQYVCLFAYPTVKLPESRPCQSEHDTLWLCLLFIRAMNNTICIAYAQVNAIFHLPTFTSAI